MRMTMCFLCPPSHSFPLFTPTKGDGGVMGLPVVICKLPSAHNMTSALILSWLQIDTFIYFSLNYSDSSV